MKLPSILPTKITPSYHRAPFRLHVEALESRYLLANLPPGFVLEPVVTGLDAGVAFDFTDDGRIFVAEKSGIIKVVDNGSSTTFADIRGDVNGGHDRGLLGLALHPEFPSEPYVYALYTYDPPGVTPDAGLSRVSRLTRFTADATTDYTTAVPGSGVVLLGNNSTLANIPQPDTRNPSVPACGAIGAYVQDCIPSDEISHSIGTLRFGNDGSLFVSSGDGGSFVSAQHYNVRAVDPDSLAGKVLRIDPLTGDGFSDNPFYDGDPASNRSKVYSLGLRNPFRFTIDPLSGEPYIGDVGWGQWEEVNTGRGANFGWPCYEGGNGTPIVQNSYAGFPECQAVYSLANTTPATHAYPHVDGSSSIQVGDFYTGVAYPAAYQDGLFFYDFNQQSMSTISFDAQRNVQQVTPFATSTGGIVQVSRGPDTNLYWMDIFSGSLSRLRYVAGGNTPPTAIASVEADTPATFRFSGQGSFDPDAEPLTYLWDFGDGSTSALINPTHTYAVTGFKTVTLTVSDPTGLSDSDVLVIDISNTPPVAQITSPADGSLYRVGDTISFTGLATDDEDGSLGGASLAWTVELHHNDHVHIDFFSGTGLAGSFVAEDHDDNSYLELCLTATDTLGGEDTSCVDLIPEEVMTTFDSTPTTLTLNYNGVDFVTPFSVTSPIGATRTVSAPPVQGGLTFAGWSDAGSATHDIVIPTTSQALTATYAGSAGSTISVRASGTTGEEIVELQIDTQPVATFALSTDLQDYGYVHPTSLSPSQIRVAFVNDLYDPPIDRNVLVDHIVLDDTIYESEDPLVLSTGTWDGTCDPGFKQSEELQCGGYFQYAETGSGPSALIEVRAAGDTGEEIIELQIDEATVATFDLTTTLDIYSYEHPTPVSADQIRVRFVNDLYAPPIDYNVQVDYVAIDNVAYQTEHPSVFSLGSWDGSCGPGFKEAESLHCGGYFEYAEAAADSPASPSPASTELPSLARINLPVNRTPVADPTATMPSLPAAGGESALPPPDVLAEPPAARALRDPWSGSLLFDRRSDHLRAQPDEDAPDHVIDIVFEYIDRDFEQF